MCQQVHVRYDIRIFCFTVLVCANGNTTSDFEALTDSYWHWRLQDAPEFASRIDVHEFDAMVEQFTFDVLEERKVKISIF